MTTDNDSPEVTTLVHVRLTIETVGDVSRSDPATFTRGIFDTLDAQPLELVVPLDVAKRLMRAPAFRGRLEDMREVELVAVTAAGPVLVAGVKHERGAHFVLAPAAADRMVTAGAVVPGHVHVRELPEAAAAPIERPTALVRFKRMGWVRNRTFSAGELVRLPLEEIEPDLHERVDFDAAPLTPNAGA